MNGIQNLDLDLEAAAIDATMSADSLPTPPQQLDHHPIIATVHEQELGKAVMSLAILIVMATFFQKSPIQMPPQLLLLIQILLYIGCVAIWNGILLRNTYPDAASLAEQAGIALVFFALNVSLASVVAKELIWFPVLCFDPPFRHRGSADRVKWPPDQSLP